jgi:membrane fusion protein (multidrug efflux system)
LRAYLIAILLLIAILGSIAGYRSWQNAAGSGGHFGPPPVTIAAATAAAEVWNTELEAVGTVRAVRGVELSVEVSGEVIALAVSSADQVEAGQLLLTLDDKVEQASSESQSASLELARLMYERDDQLLKQKSISQTQYDRSKADYDRAVALLAETRARLENRRIHAPFTGTVGIVHVSTGDYVEPGDRITTLQDLSELEVDFTVPARHYPKLRPGLSIEVRAAAFPGKSFPATLQAVDTRVDAGTRNLLLRAKLAEGSGLLPGMFAQLTIDLAKPTELLTLPETAVTYSLHGDTVFVIEGEGDELVASPRVVRTGDSREGRIAILDGLREGERVASVGQNKLYRGAKVVIDPAVQLE